MLPGAQTYNISISLIGDGVLLLVHVRQVSQRVVQLYRPARHVHPRETKADQENHNILPGWSPLVLCLPSFR